VSVNFTWIVGASTTLEQFGCFANTRSSEIGNDRR
jgi:hypothetical protein